MQSRPPSSASSSNSTPQRSRHAKTFLTPEDLWASIGLQVDLSESIYSVLHVEETEAEVAKRNWSGREGKKASKAKDCQTSSKQQTFSSRKETVADCHFHSIEDEKTTGGGMESPANNVAAQKSQESTRSRECGGANNYDCDNVKAKRANLVLLGSSFSGISISHLW